MCEDTSVGEQYPTVRSPKPEKHGRAPGAAPEAVERTTKPLYSETGRGGRAQG